MRRLVTIVLVIFASCGGTEEAEPTTVPQPPATATTTTELPAVTTTAGADTTTTSAPTTTTTVAPTTTLAGDAVFSITHVSFGDNPFVEITNVGSGPGELAGYWLCQRPGYFELPALTVEPGERIVIAQGEAEAVELAGVEQVVGAESQLGAFGPASGEIGLYFFGDGGSNFGSAEALRAYVEWGRSGHGRSSTAVEAGLWELDGFVPTPDNALALTALEPQPTGPDGWTVDVGG